MLIIWIKDIEYNIIELINWLIVKQICILMILDVYNKIDKIRNEYNKNNVTSRTAPGLQTARLQSSEVSRQHGWTKQVPLIHEGIQGVCRKNQILNYTGISRK
jgi:hypothetical protein